MWSIYQVISVLQVYHTHMEPQSLKGQLNIRYKHEVPNILRSLSSIGAIYVNGSKYPPEKPTSNTTSPSGGMQSVGPSYRNGAGNMVMVGGSVAPPNMQAHMPNSERSNLYMQMVMGRPHQPGQPPSSQGPTLSLPGSRRMGVGPHMWPNQGGHPSQVGLPGSLAGISKGVMMVPGHGSHGNQQSPQHMVQRNPFTPMRLHHRPADQGHLPTAPPMVLGNQPRLQQPHPMGLSNNHLPGKPA